MIINEQSIREACAKLADTLVQKNHDYGNSVEEQFKEYGDASINLRLEDKLRRLKNLAKNTAKVDEKKSETVLDSAGYAVLAYILYSIQKEYRGPGSEAWNHSACSNCMEPFIGKEIRYQTPEHGTLCLTCYETSI